MDELLREFLTETAKNLDHVDVQFEREPNNGQVLSNILRLVHTIKGTCGFLGLPRLEALTHAARNADGQISVTAWRSPGKRYRSYWPPRRILESLKFQILEAENGEQAFDACQRKLPDAILLD